MTIQSWRPNRSVTPTPWPQPPLTTAIGRGFMGRCPACGKAHLFNGFLKVVSACQNCAAPLGMAPADDAPPYFTILLTGHIIIPLLVLADRIEAPPLWLMSAIFIPLTLLVSIGLIRPIKGGTVGLMLTLNMLKADPTEL
ncbi:MAG TPA: DUF983 domain-containing protein [Rhodopila sp.]|nr:DUF983 domain-containing protein [Rhodopila sp.]